MVYAFSLMPDHLHAVVRLRLAGRPETMLWGAEDSPPRNLMRLIGDFKSYTTWQIAWKHGVHGRLWRRDLHDRVPRGEEEFVAQCRYVLDNPVRRGLVQAWRDYPWTGVMDSWEAGPDPRWEPKPR